MRWLAAAGLVTLLAAGCAQPAESTTADPPPSAGRASAGPVDPGRINRIGGDLPDGYEVADLAGPSSPARLWGLRPGWTADPPQCAVLADPIPRPVSARGLSGSGPGGIVYVVATVGDTGGPDRALLDGCGRWTLTSGHSTATVGVVAGPRIEGAATLGLSSTIRTVVESGTETDARAHTYLAYLPDSTVAVTLITDPGAPGAALPPEYAADLLVATVSELRG